MLQVTYHLLTNQCFTSAKCRNGILKFVYDIGSRYSITQLQFGGCWWEELKCLGSPKIFKLIFESGSHFPTILS